MPIVEKTKKKRTLDKELRQELSKEKCHEIMDYLMVQFIESNDIHYNYYFDTPDYRLAEQNITLRMRTIRKDNTSSYYLTLKVPTIDEDTYLEYNQRLNEKEMRRMAYNNEFPDGEIKELDSIHGGKVQNVNMIRVNRVYAEYLDFYVFFDKISHRGKTHYEIGTRIDSAGANGGNEQAENFKRLLKDFGVTFQQAPRRSEKYR